MVVASEGYLDAVDVEAAGDLLDGTEVEVTHLFEREVERIARVSQRSRRDIFQDELRVVEHPPSALGGRAVVVAEPRARDELHSAFMSAFTEYLDGVDAPVEHVEPAAMLRALIVLIGVGVEVEHPSLAEDLLPKGVGPTEREVVDEHLDLFG